MKIKLIIADDHQLIREGFKALIGELEDAEVIGEASDGIEVISLLKSGKLADIVLMDMEMPNMNGMETLEYIKSNFLGIKVIILTMQNDRQLITKAMENGADGFLFKDTSTGSLHEAIKQVNVGKTYFGSEVAAKLLIKESHDANSLDFNMSPRELEILKLVAEGFSSTEIGDRLFISPRTVDTHRNNLINKLGVNGIAGLIRFAIINKLA